MMILYRSNHLCEYCNFKPANCGADFLHAGDLGILLYEGATIEDPNKVVLCDKYKNAKATQDGMALRPNPEGEGESL